MEKWMKAGHSKEANDTPNAKQRSPKPTSREQLSSMKNIVISSQAEMESWGGGHVTAVTGTTVNSTPTDQYYKPTDPPLNVITVRRYWSGSRSSSENRQVYWNGRHRLWTDEYYGDLGTEEVAKWVNQIASDTITKEGKPHTIQCHDCRAISLTSHPTKVLQTSEQDGLQLNRSSTTVS